MPRASPGVLWHEAAQVRVRSNDILQALLAPIRGRRTALARDPGYVLDVLRQGTMRAQRRTQATRDALQLFRLSG
jgi:tryptophanyl-tRNA synthetase